VFYLRSYFRILIFRQIFFSKQWLYTITFIFCQTSLILLAVLEVVSRASPFNLAAFLIPSARKFTFAVYVKALFSCSVRSCWFFLLPLHSLLCSKDVCGHTTDDVIEKNTPEHLRELKRLTQNLCRTTQHVVLEHFFSILSLLFHLLKISLQNDSLSNIFTSTSESLSTSVSLSTTFCTSWHLTSIFFTNFFLSYSI
jgi:hypothetical protein